MTSPTISNLNMLSPVECNFGLEVPFYRLCKEEGRDVCYAVFLGPHMLYLQERWVSGGITRDMKLCYKPWIGVWDIKSRLYNFTAIKTHIAQYLLTKEEAAKIAWNYYVATFLADDVLLESDEK